MILLAFILQVVFFVLKITGAVHWAWPVVLIPLWIALVFTGLAAVRRGLLELFEHLDRRQGQKTRKGLGW